MEFFTLVSNEFQKPGLGMWRGDNSSLASMQSLGNQDSVIVASPFGLFPSPWCPSISVASGIEFSEVIRKFFLLGQVVAKALHDGRVLDLPFSKAFYKLFFGQELTVYDIQSFDPDLGKTLIEFQALVQRRKYLESVRENSTAELDSCFRGTKIEDLHLDFTLPGYPDYILASGPNKEMVNATNLEEYIDLVVDATINSGISRQMDAFKSGFDQVFQMKHLQIFTDEELERLLCGESETWNSNQLSDLIKFDHGYTASSPPIIHLLEILQEVDYEQQRAFLKFVTGAPRLPLGGLSSLNPKLTIVRKHCDKLVDADLPSVMTCANYLKLPPYSTKETMKEKLFYAITEGQGALGSGGTEDMTQAVVVSGDWWRLVVVHDSGRWSNALEEKLYRKKMHGFKFDKHPLSPIASLCTVVFIVIPLYVMLGF
ncbi:HECT-like protein [Cynara cardunculus var. scolymus]|uniref:HECT-like protein n=1 Tax=Cynara cardunculus var. scolymus TaxID=59895 RepID=A0A103Y007_CYNCS|nr:HECT-like protein [Cynara cardunculus var. scolymus]